MRSLRDVLRRFAGDESGVAAIEMALVGTLLTGLLLNCVEVGRYAYLSTQVTAASQAAAHAAITKCDPSETPVATKCPAAQAAIEIALEGTSLGDEVALSGALDEAWYCLDAQGVLQEVSEADSKPGNCSAFSMPAGPPALYLRLRATYTYEPIFPGLTITGNFPATIARTAWMRML